MNSRILGLCITLALLPQVASSQIANLEPGERVRVTVPAPRKSLLNRSEAHFAGQFVSIEGDSLILAADWGSRVSFPLDQVRRLHVSQGTRSLATRGAILGASWGGGLVGIGWAVDAASRQTCDWFCPDAGDYVRGIALGALVGAMIGVVAGSAADGEKWTSVRLPSSSAVKPFAHLRGAGLSIGI